jgi:hypothetical protein
VKTVLRLCAEHFPVKTVLYFFDDQFPVKTVLRLPPDPIVAMSGQRTAGTLNGTSILGDDPFGDVEVQLRRKNVELVGNLVVDTKRTKREVEIGPTVARMCGLLKVF